MNFKVAKTALFDKNKNLRYNIIKIEERTINDV